ncbi:hypothetical protein BDF20DRAFT_285905 [Mycotypha africana]|uniref:uncharacterized protein n=1 Tax=Mycotypha africana TaxID=64632 RepID=UPI0023007046|nr:uncharacterized protein BDF20DRAFT_285905 [Mycotypha africana]KAI8987723.1 hypothetical protein BDF20DRAFT_285905 [Mycotypha africana]
MDPYIVHILTVSDTASQDGRADKSGPLLKKILEASGRFNVKKDSILPDDLESIRSIIQNWAEHDQPNLILTTGGTGFAERDVTPEAIKPVLDRETLGLTHLLLSSSISITPFAALSRPVTGILKKTLIVTLPGSPKACEENLGAIMPVLPHALDLLLARETVKKQHSEIQDRQISGVSNVRAAAKIQSSSGQHTCSHHEHDLHSDEADIPQSGLSTPLETPVSRRARKSPYPVISVERAKEIIEENIKTLNIISLPVSQYLLNYILAEDVFAMEPVPGYRASVVDGYAVHAEDGIGIYPVESVSLANVGIRGKELNKGKITRITTGGMVPEGANAVIMVEDTKLIKASPTNKNEELEIEILAQARFGDNIREVGVDCQVGELVAKKGHRISTEDIGLLASVGVRHVKVYRKPRVGVLSTGNEVVDHIHTDTLKPGQIRDTNRITLLSAVQSAGFEAVDLGIVGDKVDEMTECLEEALDQVDVLITTGGVSMGEADFVKPILEQKLGATLHFGRILMKPGKPTTFATLQLGPENKRPPKIIFALPGNPVSASVGLYLFVVPSLRRMAGWTGPSHTTVPVKIKHDIYLDSRPEYHRVQVCVDSEDGTLTAQSTGNQQSSRMLSMVNANGLLALPSKKPDLTVLTEGATVPCILIGPLVNEIN